MSQQLAGCPRRKMAAVTALAAVAVTIGAIAGTAGAARAQVLDSLYQFNFTGVTSSTPFSPTPGKPVSGFFQFDPNEFTSHLIEPGHVEYLYGFPANHPSRLSMLIGDETVTGLRGIVIDVYNDWRGTGTPIDRYIITVYPIDFPIYWPTTPNRDSFLRLSFTDLTAHALWSTDMVLDSWRFQEFPSRAGSFDHQRNPLPPEFRFSIDTLTSGTGVPEPSTLILAGLAALTTGIVGLLSRQRRRLARVPQNAISTERIVPLKGNGPV